MNRVASNKRRGKDNFNHNREIIRAKTNIRILLVLMSNKALTPLNNNREFCIVFVPLQSVFKPTLTKCT